MVNCCTPFSAIYTSFFSKITDDMYMELDRKQTEGMLQELLIGAIPWFEFPKVNIFDYDLNYRALLMMKIWRHLMFI